MKRKSAGSISTSKTSGCKIPWSSECRPTDSISKMLISRSGISCNLRRVCAGRKFKTESTLFVKILKSLKLKVNIVHKISMGPNRPVPIDLTHHLLSKKWRKMVKWSKLERCHLTLDECHKSQTRKNYRWEHAKLTKRILRNHQQITNKHRRPWWRMRMRSSAAKSNS